MTDKPISDVNAKIFLHHGKVSGGEDKTNASTSLLGTASDSISAFLTLWLCILKDTALSTV